jgi:peptidoglycan/LPS O-acetylase OafA/YrhL
VERSIGVEFSFYFLFPLLAFYVNSLIKSFVFFLLGLTISFSAYFVTVHYYESLYGEQAADNFLFFWLPNQIGVFALSFVLFFVINVRDNPLIFSFREHCSKPLITVILFCVVMVLSQLGISKHFTQSMPWLPTHYVISIVFFILFIGLYSKAPSIFVNKFFTRLGEVSFSAYVLHFAVIQGCQSLLYTFFFTARDWESILYFGLVLPFVILMTYLFSNYTYRFIEMPFIALGRKISKIRF